MSGKDNTRLESIIADLLRELGDDTSREGLHETPKRVAKAWREWTCGYTQNPAEILKTFVDGAPEKHASSLVIVHGVPVISRCEHHLAEVTGIAHVGYIPNGKVVGLSKLARLVDMFARRLQVQERMTDQIADALVDNLQPVGVGVLVRASHSCMSTRGVRIHGSTTSTSAMRGALLHDQAARAEFMMLCQIAENHGG